ncbi:cell morphogenesis C-terminal-domain-containing protein [Umbelopsis sp. PMI_123]|nr:cell morphogenesis C-terminal-domain-containing protein [Umbelopsis sp. PMI_123]
MLVIDEKNITWRPGSNNANAQTSYSVPSFVNTVGGITAAESGQHVHHQYAAFSATYSKEKQPYIDLLRVIVSSIPRISTPGITLPKIVELLARYTTYVDPEMIRAASLALVRLAKEGNAQTVVSGYSRFIYRIEDRYAEVITSLANGPITGGNFNGNGGVLKLYTDLLVIWVEQLDVAELKKVINEVKTADEPNPNTISEVQTKLSDIYSMIEEIEANGLLFLCSKLSAIRRPAIQIMKLVAQLDARLQQYLGPVAQDDMNRRPISMTSHRTSHIARSREYNRIYDLLEQVGQSLIKFDKDSNILHGRKIAILERVRLQQHQRRDAKHVLIQLAESDHASDIMIWEALFPEVVKLCFEHFPGTVALCRQNICTRLLQMQSLIQAAVEGSKVNTSGTLSMPKTSASSISNRIASVELIDQWKTYLMFTCSTSTLSQDRLPTSTWANSGRKQSAVVERIANTRDLFRMIMQFLTCEHRTIREAAVQGLGTINKDVYKVLMEDLQVFVSIILEDSKQKSYQKPYQYKRTKKHDRLRIAVMNVFQLTADCLREEVFLRDKLIMDTLMSYVKETKTFLAGAEVQTDWEFHRLRVYLCQLVEKLYEHISKLDDPSSIMSFETRLALFKMFEEWCGYGAFASVTRTREATMMRDVLEQCKDSRERGEMTKLMEEERKALETAALSGMAALCRGSVYAFIGQKKAKQAVIQFDIVNLLRWIDAVFESHDTKYHMIARRALEAVLIYNQDQALLLDDIIEQCYAGNPKLEFTQGYFLALADIITRVDDYPCHIHQIMSVALFKAGDAKKTIRKAAIRLLRVIEERVFVDSCAKEYEIGIISNLPTIYKYTQSLLSARLAVDHPEQTYSILSEITQRFEHINSNNQREVLNYMLPWLRNVDLSVGPQDTELSSSAFMVCSNIFYITVKYGDIYVKEVAALWSQLVTEHVQNVRAIIMYLLDLGLEKRNPWFVIHAKRVLVCLGRTSALSHVVDEVVAEITPRSMVPQLKEASKEHANAFPFLFVADIEQVLPPYPKRAVFSRGQLATVFLVELAIEAGGELSGHLPLLLHSIFVQLDHLTSIICDQSRCLLINIIHSIVVRQTTDMDTLQKATNIVEMLTAKEGKRLWSYENITYKNRNLQSSVELQNLLEQIVDIFLLEEPDLRQKWGETALKWATCCSVRHIACRSFQCFRALMPVFNQHMLADMLARLSNTIADKSEDIRGFALEILLTLHEVADSLDGTISDHFLKLFWVSVACMYSPYEPEHHEAVLLLDKVLSNIDSENSSAYSELAANFPKNWASEFDGLQPLLLKGVRMTATEEAALNLVKKTMFIDEPALIDPAETRLMYLLFACIPRLLHGLEGETPDGDCILLASSLARLFEGYKLPSIQRILMTYSRQKSKFQQEYVKQLVMSTREVFLQKYGQQAAAFSVSLLRNKIPFYREKTLMLLKELIPHVSAKSSPSITLDETAIAPLLQLLQTDYAEDALAIMDEGIVIKSDQQDDNAESSSSEPKLYWDVSDPSETARVTRHNVHAVVFECSAVTDELPSEHNFQFSVEDLSLLMGENANVGAEYAPTDNSTAAYGDDLVNALKDLDEFFNEDLDKADGNVENSGSDNYPVDFKFQVAPPSPVTPPIFYKTPSALFDFSRKLINRAGNSNNNNNNNSNNSTAVNENASSSVRFPDPRTLDLSSPTRPEHHDHIIETAPRQSFDTSDLIDSSDSDSTFDERHGDAESHRSGKSGRSRRSRKSAKSPNERHGHYF